MPEALPRWQGPVRQGSWAPQSRPRVLHTGQILQIRKEGPQWRGLILPRLACFRVVTDQSWAIPAIRSLRPAMAKSPLREAWQGHQQS